MNISTIVPDGRESARPAAESFDPPRAARDAQAAATAIDNNRTTPITPDEAADDEDMFGEGARKACASFRFIKKFILEPPSPPR